jgi:hypothetical protein
LFAGNWIFIRTRNPRDFLFGQLIVRWIVGTLDITIFLSGWIGANDRQRAIARYAAVANAGWNDDRCAHTFFSAICIAAFVIFWI